MKIWFVNKSNSSFIKQDYEILKRHFDMGNSHDFDVAFSWFANWKSAYAVQKAKKVGKKSVVVVGGYDVAYEPSMGYGAFAKFKETIPAKYVLKNADLLLPVSQFTKREILERIGRKKIRGEIHVVYNGVDTKKFIPSKEKKDIIFSMGRKGKEKLKGIDTFFEAMKFLPYKYEVIGYKKPIPHDEVAKKLSIGKIFCQLSWRESFGMGIAEAMSCGCVPVVTHRGAIPEVVGDAGIYVSYGDPYQTLIAVECAFRLHRFLSERARKRIQLHFPLERREKTLVEMIECI